MHQNRHYQVLHQSEEGVKIAPLDFCLQKPPHQEVLVAQPQTRRKVTDKSLDIFKR
jgi:hypothetical protein